MKFWKKYISNLLLIIFFLSFIGLSVFVSTRLREDIVPDEPYHFEVSRQFTHTWGIPENVPTVEQHGSIVRQTPYLSYWLYGRALSAFDLLQPGASRWSQLVFLRIFNSALSVGMLIFTYLISKELIRNKWWRLLPVFVLSNTLMFVLLSSGVNYDNLANLFSAAGVYFLIRVLNKKDFLSNSLGWLISIALGTWVKEALLPLALAMVVVWVVFIIKNRTQVRPLQVAGIKTICLGAILLMVIGANFSIYGVNLIRYQSLTPSCSDNFTAEFCASTGFARRRAELALPEKPNVFQAFRQGYPEPVRYTFDTWVRAMLMKVFGIMGGQQSYYPIIISYYHILFYWMLVLGVRYIRGTSFKIYSLAGIVGFYTLTLFIKNYDIELAYGFIQVAHQGRYIFPVISLIFALFSYGLYAVPNKLVRLGTLGVTILLFIYGGPIRFIWYYNSVFADWFI